MRSIGSHVWIRCRRSIARWLYNELQWPAERLGAKDTASRQIVGAALARVVLPCHGSQYDISGRIRKELAPRNLVAQLLCIPC